MDGAERGRDALAKASVFIFNILAYNAVMRVITVCGSGKFKPLIHGVCAELEKRGYVVLTPPLHNIDGATAGAVDETEAKRMAWKGATFAHFNRLQKTELCVMVNPGSYLGVSSTLELGYAVATGQLIVALRHDVELSRDVLFDVVLETEDMHEIADRVEKILKS